MVSTPATSAWRWPFCAGGGVPRLSAALPLGATEMLPLGAALSFGEGDGVVGESPNVTKGAAEGSGGCSALSAVDAYAVTG